MEKVTYHKVGCIRPSIVVHTAHSMEQILKMALTSHQIVVDLLSRELRLHCLSAIRPVRTILLS